MQDDPKKWTSYDLIGSELLRRGYGHQLVQLDTKYTCFTAPDGGIWFTRNAMLSYPFMSPVAKSISIDKMRSYLFIKDQGASIAQTLLYPDEANDIGSFLKKYAPVVVKPADSSGSRGITYDVSDIDSLMQAISIAKTLSEKVILQQQFYGAEVRITVSRGRVLSAIHRKTPQVVGNGTSTIAKLIVEENYQRSKIKLKLVDYPQLTKALIPAAALTDQTVLPAGVVYELAKDVRHGQGGSPTNITDELHHTYAELAVRLSSIISPHFFVVDMMIHNYTQPLTPNNYIVLEFTSSPNLRMYYVLRNKQQPEIVPYIADLIDEYCASQRPRLS